MVVGCQPRTAVSQAKAASQLHDACHASDSRAASGGMTFNEGQAAGAPCDVLDLILALVMFKNYSTCLSPFRHQHQNYHHYHIATNTNIKPPHHHHTATTPPPTPPPPLPPPPSPPPPSHDHQHHQHHSTTSTQGATHDEHEHHHQPFLQIYRKLSSSLGGSRYADTRHR